MATAARMTDAPRYASAAEVSFLTNKQELALLKNASYKQRIAEALHAAVLRYRRSLKGQGVIAAK